MHPFWRPFPKIDFGMRFGRRLAPLWLIVGIHVDDMLKILVSFLLHFKCHRRQFLQVSCFQMVRFHGQHLKVSAVALPLQSTLGGQFSNKKVKNVESPVRRGES